MKANGAPEKIYLNPLLMEDGESVVRLRTFERQRDSQLEYIRTDAFIEKAARWLFNQANIYTDIEVDRNNGGVYTKFHADEMVKDFIKAMKL